LEGVFIRNFRTIHERAVEAARKFQKAEAELLSLFQEIDKYKVFRKLGFNSLFEYGVTALNLSEGQVYALIRVARKSIEVPELKQAVSQGDISVSKAKRIVSVINKSNQTEWIEKAKALPQKKLELEVVKVNPRESVPERVRPVAENLMDLRCGVKPGTNRKLERVKDLLSQKMGRACTLEDALAAMADLYLEKNDPVEKARRAQNRPSPTKKMSCRTAASKKRQPIPTNIRHQVNLRDGGQCSFEAKKTGRCANRRWLEVHHIRPVSEGGPNIVSNLRTLCSSHHKMQHEIHLR